MDSVDWIFHEMSIFGVFKDKFLDMSVDSKFLEGLGIIEVFDY